MEPADALAPLYTIAPDQNSFTALGVTYTAINPEDLSVARYRVFQKNQVAFGFNHTFSAFCAELDAAWAALEAGQMGTAAKTLGNLRDAVTYAGQSRFTGEDLVALFFNTPGENAALWDKDVMNAKYAAWQEAGMPASFFFQQAARYVSGFYQRFMQLSLPPTASSSQSPPPSPAGSPS